jgi:hypothetical protein
LCRREIPSTTVKYKKKRKRKKTKKRENCEWPDALNAQHTQTQADGQKNTTKKTFYCFLQVLFFGVYSPVWVGGFLRYEATVEVNTSEFFLLLRLCVCVCGQVWQGTGNRQQCASACVSTRVKKKKKAGKLPCKYIGREKESCVQRSEG